MTKVSRRFGAAAFALASATVFTAAPVLAEGAVNIYSYRQPELIKPLLETFTSETGIETNVLFLDKGLEERVAEEGANSPVDVILTVDIGRLQAAEDKGVTQPLADEAVNADIPAQYRDPDGNWFGVTTRARVVYASKERVKQDAITYEELADPKWKGKICTRSGQHVYSIGLIAAMVAHHGAEKAEAWLKGVKANLARKPDGGDRDQAKAVFAGQCDIALGNTYYVAQMQTNTKEPEQQDWAASIKVMFPNAAGRGTHVNISGMALAKHAPNRDNAVKLMRFLASDKGQTLYGQQVYEYPVDAAIMPADIVAAWGELKPDTLPLADIAKNRKAASEIVDRVQFDDGPES